MKKLKLVLPILFVTASVYASHDVHTWHIVSSQNGTWNATLATINENASFVNADGLAMNNFTISPANPFKYGFSFDTTDDFDVAYTLTLTQKNPTAITSKACVFVVTAKGPANPDIRALSYNNANCAFTIVHGVGEDFMVS